MSDGQELDSIAKTAWAIVEDVRQVDPMLTLETLAFMARDEPVRFAQVAMALAVWVDPNLTTQALWRRANTARMEAAA